MSTPKKARTPRLPPSLENDPPGAEVKSTVRWKKSDEGEALHYAGVDTPLIALTFEGFKSDEGITFAEELARRGYDLTTLRFSCVRRAEHPWIRVGRCLWLKRPARGASRAKLGWIEVRFVRYLGKRAEVVFVPYAPDGSPLHHEEISGHVPGACHRIGEVLRYIPLGKVEELYQPMPPDAAWSPDELPPMFPRSPR